jgi:hypothetical protein
MLLKQFVRPVFDEELIAPLLALGWSIILTWRADWKLRAALSGAAVAGIVTLLGTADNLSLSGYLSGAISSPVDAVRTALVAFEPGARHAADRARVDPARFGSWPDEQIAGDYALSVLGRPLPAFAIVGDSQMTYVLLRQPPPYQVDLYDASPIAEQQAMVDVLRKRQTPYVIWRRDYLVDGVPYNVRDPLVFAWMVENYVPVRVFPTVTILRRRRTGEAIPAGFWRQELGGTEDLGYIPSFSTAASSSPCAGGSGCVPYVLLRGLSAHPGTGLAFVIHGNGQSYGVLMRSRGGVATYAVRLDRLWFWHLVGPTVAITVLTPGFTGQVAGRLSGGNLY